MYFRGVITLGASTILIGYLGGRTCEYFANRYYYKDMIEKYAVAYNITDEEIEDLHRSIQEKMLIKNKEDQIQKGGTLDRVKFK